MSAVPRKEDFTQVCIWPATIVGAERVAEFEAWMLDEFHIRVQYLEEVTTLPNYGDPTTGGSNDVIFAVHKDDVAKFAVPRFAIGVRWVEDVLDNEQRHNMERTPAIPFYSIYPAHVKEYRTW